MKSFIKKYKYICIFLLAILIISYICYKNYGIIENFTCKKDLITGIKINTESAYAPKFYEFDRNLSKYYLLNFDNNDNSYNCFYNFTDTSAAHTNYRNGLSYEEFVYNCIKGSDNSGVDYYTISSNKCSYYKFNSNSEYPNNQLFIKSDSNNCDISKSIFDISTDSLNPINKLGKGGLTSLGKSKIINDNNNKSYLKVYNPLCIDEYNIIYLTRKINDCSNNCTQYSNDLINAFTDSKNSLNYIGEIEECSGNSTNCFFESSGSLINKLKQKFSESTISEISANNISNLDNSYNEILAIEKESSLNTKSTTLQYLILTVIFIISVIMFILNITNPDIITAEILTGYILFIAIIIFITSKFFNVDYGIFNKLFSLHLGNPGDRNIFQSPLIIST